MTSPSHSRKTFAIWFWVYGMILLIATHAPAKDVQFLAHAVDYGLLDPDKLSSSEAAFSNGWAGTCCTACCPSSTCSPSAPSTRR